MHATIAMFAITAARRTHESPFIDRRAGAVSVFSILLGSVEEVIQSGQRDRNFSQLPTTGLNRHLTEGDVDGFAVALAVHLVMARKIGSGNHHL